MKKLILSLLKAASRITSKNADAGSFRQKARRVGALSLKKGIIYINVTIQLWDEKGRLLVKRESYLPEDRQLELLYGKWRSLYSSYYQDLGCSTRMEIEDSPVSTLRFSQSDFKQTSKQLAQQLNRWFADESFAQVEQQLHKHLNQSDEIQVIVETESDRLRRFPWHLWHFFRDYPKAEIALSLPEYERVAPPTKEPSGNVKILGLLGSSQTINGDAIDVGEDKRIIEGLPGAQARFLVEPSRAILNTQLWEQCWDILFFAGHSGSQSREEPDEGERGRIYINSDDLDNSLTASELEYALREATQKGLRLAIFNSCDSLGLAWDLAQLNIPQIIAMREAVPDEVAQAFLRYFLKAFAGGKSFHLAVREARERLQGLEDRFPCASWLPVICQNPTAETLTWKNLRGEKSQLTWQKRLPVLLASCAIAFSVVGVRSLGWLQPLELKAFDWLVRLQPPEQPDNRIALVTIEEADLQYQDRQGMERKGSLSDDALEQLLAKIKPYQPKAIGIDIFHDFPFQPSLAKIVENDPHFIAICEVGQSNITSLSIASAPGIPPERTGFADMPHDPDETMRRQLLVMASSPSCATSQSLSFRLALNYLAQKGIELKPRNNKNEIQIGGVTFKRLTKDAGGYQLPAADALGDQILIRYRAASFAQVSLRDVLSNASDSQLPDLIRDRIVLIGVSNSSQDFHRTPYSHGAWPKKMPGLFIQAHSLSQILSAVEDKRPLLWWWTQGGEIIWIALWAGIGTTTAWYARKPLYLSIAIVGELCLLWGVCFIFLVQGGWVPLVPTALALIANGIVVSNIRAAVWLVKPAKIKDELGTSEP
jgi:CHASE2 domain-containing sensor protein